MKFARILLSLGSLSVVGCFEDAPDPAGTVPAPAAVPSEDAGGAPVGCTSGERVPLTRTWTVAGSDARGSFEGRVRLTADGAKVAVERRVEYANRVEDGRKLVVVWSGTGTVDDDGGELAFRLARRGFVRSRGELVRTEADAAPLLVAARIVRDGSRCVRASFDLGEGDRGEEHWFDPREGGPPVAPPASRTLVNAHDPWSNAERTALFAAYAGYRTLPAVAPWASLPAFSEAQHAYVIDVTDRDLYRASPDALIVRQKRVDAISLLEAKARANAFRYTLAKKAELGQAEIDESFFDPVARSLASSLDASGKRSESGDGALWLGEYAASQAYRFEVTGDPGARARYLAALEGIVTLTEIVDGAPTFARTLRRSTGTATAPWHAGKGAFAGLDWLEGGNNDMVKGVFYGLVFAPKLACGAPDSASLCARAKRAAKRLADDVPVAGTRVGANPLLSNWLASYLTGEWKYRLEAEALVVPMREVLATGGTVYEAATADWSGTNLNFVQYRILARLASEHPLSGSSAFVRDGVARAQDTLRRLRMPLWNMTAGVMFGRTEALEDAKARLAEMPVPKVGMDVDHRLDADFCMSPFPDLPWKLDWTTTDRTRSLYGYPLFEVAHDEYAWKNGGFDYRLRTEGVRVHAVDFVYAYWLGRKLGALGPAE